MQIDIITIFPKVFYPYLDESIIGRAQKKDAVSIKIHNLRDYTDDKHKTVDDKPYGGGAGMVMKVEPVYKAVKDIKKEKAKKQKIILLSAKGKKFDQKSAYNFSKLEQLILICGHYEGVDERVAKYIADEEVSIGDYILTGGELPAMVVADSVVRLIPGVINKESLREESFIKFDNKKEYPQYTRPEKIKIDNKERRVPEVLVSGNHKEIEKWKSEKSEN